MRCKEPCNVLKAVQQIINNFFKLKFDYMHEIVYSKYYWLNPELYRLNCEIYSKYIEEYDTGIKICEQHKQGKITIAELICKLKEIGLSNHLYDLKGFVPDDLLTFLDFDDEMSENKKTSNKRMLTTTGNTSMKRKKILPTPVKIQNTPAIQPESNKMDQPEQNLQKKLILEHRYPLNKSCTKWLAIGLNPIKNMEIEVRITNFKSVNGIAFDLTTWHEFLRSENLISQYFKGLSNVEYQKLLEHELNFYSIESKKVISIQQQNLELCIGKESFDCLFDIKDIINTYIKFLNTFNFMIVYNNVLTSVVNNGDNIFENLNKVLDNEINLYYVGIKELVKDYPGIVKDHVYKLKT